MTRKNRNIHIHLEEMMKAGVHLSHRTQYRMAPYIASKRKGKHIINIIGTVYFLSKGCDLVFLCSK